MQLHDITLMELCFITELTLLMEFHYIIITLPSQNSAMLMEFH